MTRMLFLRSLEFKQQRTLSIKVTLYEWIVRIILKTLAHMHHGNLMTLILIRDKEVR